MYDVTEKYKEYSSDYGRYIVSKIVIGDYKKNESGSGGSWSDSRTYYSNDLLIGWKIIEGNGTGGGFAIGRTYCKSLELTLDKGAIIYDKARIKVFVQIARQDDTTEWLPFGFFYTDKLNKPRNSPITLTAYDKMLQLEKSYKSKLSYPCKLSDIWGEIVEQAKISAADVDFVLDERVMTKPLKGRDGGKTLYYTRREMLGFIASANGGNAYFDKENRLSITKHEDIGETAGLKNSTNISVSGVEYEINDVVLVTDGVTISRDDEKDVFGTVEFENALDFPEGTPLVERIKEKIAGISYIDAVVEKQGYGYYEIGDRLKVEVLSGATQNILVTGIVYTCANGGFSERIISSALSESATNYKSSSSVSGSSSSSGCNCAPLTGLNVSSGGFTARYGNQTVQYTWEKDAQGRITKLTTDGVTIPITWE